MFAPHREREREREREKERVSVCLFVCIYICVCVWVTTRQSYDTTWKYTIHISLPIFNQISCFSFPAPKRKQCMYVCRDKYIYIFFACVRACARIYMLFCCLLANHFKSIQSWGLVLVCGSSQSHPRWCSHFTVLSPGTNRRGQGCDFRASRCVISLFTPISHCSPCRINVLTYHTVVSLCAVCGAWADKKCSRCESRVYCCREHQVWLNLNIYMYIDIFVSK